LLVTHVHTFPSKRLNTDTAWRLFFDRRPPTVSKEQNIINTLRVPIYSVFEFRTPTSTQNSQRSSHSA